MIERQIKYDFLTDTGEQVSHRNKWTFLLVNQSTQIKMIKQRILEQLAPVSDLYDHYSISIPSSRGLQCVVFSFSSDVGRLEDKSKIYASRKFRRKRDLSIIRDEAGWGDYVSGFLGI